MRVSARVQITVEFELESSWGGDFPIDKIHEQAREEAIDVLRKGLVVRGLTIKGAHKTDAQVVGEPKVTAVLVES